MHTVNADWVSDELEALSSEKREEVDREIAAEIERERQQVRAQEYECLIHFPDSANHRIAVRVTMKFPGESPPDASERLRRAIGRIVQWCFVSK